jgi:hypothetical protein
VGAEVIDLVPGVGEVAGDEALEPVAGMVRGDGNPHGPGS